MEKERRVNYRDNTQFEVYRISFENEGTGVVWTREGRGTESFSVVG